MAGVEWGASAAFLHPRYDTRGLVIIGGKLAVALIDGALTEITDDLNVAMGVVGHQIASFVLIFGTNADALYRAAGKPVTTAVLIGEK